jgi:uncharacterized protein YdeI (YjbR/CyaY-like superfamily)
MDILFVKTPAQLRMWLTKNHDKKKELWVGFYKKSVNRPGITYSEAVDQALCFGWIDGIRKSIDDISYMNRFSPRKPNSTWSAVNITRAEELTELGLMDPSGLKAFRERNPRMSQRYSYETKPPELAPDFEKRFRRNKKAWSFFETQPPGYRRTALFWVISAKREETRRRRLDTLIEDSENGRRLGMLARPNTSK